MSVAPPPRIAILLKGYPRLSETFIAQELLALEGRGLPLAIWSLRRPTDPDQHPMHEAVRAPVAYLPEYLRDAPLRVLAALLAALRDPRLPALLGLFVRDLLRDPTANRLRRFGQALVLARDLPDAVVHLHAHFLHAPASVARYCAVLTGRTWSFSAHAKDIWTTPDWDLAQKLAQADWGVTCTRDGLVRLRSLMPTSARNDEPGCESLEATRPSPTHIPRPEGPARGGGLEGALPNPPRCPEDSLEAAHAVSRDGGEDGVGVDRRWPRLALAYHGLDLARFPAPPPSRPARDGSDPADPLRLLCVGRLVAKKGHDDLLAALASLPPDLHWRLDLIGDGECRAALQARAGALDLSGRIAFRGALAQPGVVAELRAADLFVLPAKPAADGDRDGLPNVLMEAASQELPILATAFAGTPEFIVHGRHGLLVPPDDPAALSSAILHLARAPDERRRFGRIAHERLLRDFSMEAGITLIAARLSASAGLAPVPLAAPASLATEMPACAC